jgi:CheY-like chemotaxis protein
MPTVLMKCIASFTDKAPPASPDATANDAAQRFAAHAHLRVLAVTGPDRAMGLVRRDTIDRALKAGLGRTPLSALMNRQPRLIDAAAPIDAVLDMLLADRAEDDAFLVIEDGAACGAGDLRGLFDRLAAQTLPGPREIREVVVDTASDAERVNKAAVERMRRLTRSAAEEFRSHVKGVIAMTELLLRQPLGHDALAQAHSIQAAGDTMMRLADDAVDLLDAREGGLQLRAQPTLLRALIDEVQDHWGAQALHPDIGLLIAYDGEHDLTVDIDAERLRQVFDNLIENAVRCTRQGSVEASLRARLEGQDVVLEGRVRDTSPGLTAAKLARIFDSPEDGAKGASIPIALTREIVQSMRGSIRAESNVGQGLTVVFDLMAPASQIRAEPQPDQGLPPGAAHVLVVDDNATNRMVAQALCEMFDCTSECAEDGVEAVEIARSGRFDLILMDIKMPRMDGIAATKAIRALPGRAGKIPIVALTANVDPDDARGYLAAGMCCVVEKPIKPDRLLQAINIALAEAPEEARVAAA